ncbi:MAG TPA: hypothetical protein VER03_25660 [Bryobacteraceae bacterium]|nr:hypothetical protein [Bryobacteraceae bacterium]
MDELRLGDIIDDYCIKCRRLTNHAIVSIVEGEAAKVRCRSCYHDHTYLKEQIPPSKKDLKKMELFNAVLANSGGAPAAEAESQAVAGAVVAAEPAEATASEAVEPAKKNRVRSKKA